MNCFLVTITTGTMKGESFKAWAATKAMAIETVLIAQGLAGRHQPLAMAERIKFKVGDAMPAMR